MTPQEMRRLRVKEIVTKYGGAIIDNKSNAMGSNKTSGVPVPRE